MSEHIEVVQATLEDGSLTYSVCVKNDEVHFVIECTDVDIAYSLSAALQGPFVTEIR
jgi:hypothetical protein